MQYNWKGVWYLMTGSCSDAADSIKNARERALMEKYGEYKLELTPVTIERTGNTITRRGKSVIDSILKPIRDTKKLRNEAKGQDKWNYDLQLNKYYAAEEDDMPLSNFMTALHDDEVQKYIKSMDTEEYAKLREEVAQSLGGKASGDAARMLEKTYKEVNLVDIEKQYKKLGQLDTISADIAKMRGEGLLTRNDLTTIDAWKKLANEGGIKTSAKPIEEMTELEFKIAKGKAEEAGLSARAREMQGKWDESKALRIDNEIKNYDYNKITEVTARGEYDKLTRELGRENADTIFSNKLLKDIQQIDEEVARSDKGERLILGQDLNKQENQLLNDLMYGKKPTPDDVKSIQNILNKISPEGWNRLRVPLRRMQTLERSSVEGIAQKANKSLVDKITGTSKGAMGVAAFALTIFYAIPQSLLWFGTSTPTNIAEMTGLYEQFKQGKEDTQTLIDKILTQESMQQINEYLLHWGNLLETPPYSIFLSIPLYGDYISWYIKKPLDSNAIAVKANFNRMFIDMKNVGLVKEANNAIGYETTTNEEKIAIYSGDPSILFGNDGGWVKKYGDQIWGENSGIVDPITGKTLSGTEAMMLYYNYNGDGIADYTTLGKLGGSIQADADKIQQNYPNTYDDIMKFGKEHDRQTTEQQATTQTPGTITPEARAWMGSMNGMGLSQEQIDTNISLGRSAVPDGRGGYKWEGGAPRGTELPGGTAGSGGGSGSRTGTTVTLDKQYTPREEAAIKTLREKSSLSDTEKEAGIKAIATKETKEDAIEKVKEATGEKLTLKEIVKVTGDNSLKPYVKKNLGSLSKDVIKEAARINKEETANAILENAVSSTCGGD
jgi:hypothetical protein